MTDEVTVPVTTDETAPATLPTEPAPAAAEAADVEASTATVSIDVPAQHQSLLERAAALLEKADQWIVDNIEAGITHFEGLFKSDESDKTE